MASLSDPYEATLARRMRWYFAGLQHAGLMCEVQSMGCNTGTHALQSVLWTLLARYFCVCWRGQDADAQKHLKAACMHDTILHARKR